MTRKLLLVGLLALPVSFACTANSNSVQDKAGEQDESKQPPLKYTLKLGEKSATLTEGETARVEGTFTNPEVTLTAEAHRVFPYQGISFEYPRDFVFEAQVDNPDHKVWTLSGNDFKIMYFVMNVDLTTTEMADGMVEEFGRKNCKVTQATALKFGNQALSGTSLNAIVVGSKMVIDIYRIPSDGEQSKLLVLQDSLDDAGNRSIEGKAALRQLSRSSKLMP